MNEPSSGYPPETGSGNEEGKISIVPEGITGSSEVVDSLEEVLDELCDSLVVEVDEPSLGLVRDVPAPWQETNNSIAKNNKDFFILS